MKRFQTWSICAFTLVMPADSLAKDDGPDRPCRFSQVEIQLLQAYGSPYELDGTPSNKKTMDELHPVVVELAKSDNPRVKELALVGCAQYELLQLFKENRGDLNKVVEKQAEKSPEIFLGMLVDAAKNATKNERVQDVKKAGELIEELLGPNAQRTQNQGFALIFFGKALGKVQSEKIANLANEVKIPGVAQKTSIKVSIDLTPKKMGWWSVKNTGKADFHHCLIRATTVPDLATITRAGGDELLLNRLILPPAGFSRPTVDGFQQAVVLRTMIASISADRWIYVPVLKAGSTVSFRYPFSARLCKSGDLSLWCDEGNADAQAVENWAQAIEALSKPSGSLIVPKRP